MLVPTSLPKQSTPSLIEEKYSKIYTYHEMTKTEKMFMNVLSTQKDGGKRSLKSLRPGLSLPHFSGVLSSSVFSGGDQPQ
jgi:hypothetical protein